MKTYASCSNCGRTCETDVPITPPVLCPECEKSSKEGGAG